MVTGKRSASLAREKSTDFAHRFVAGNLALDFLNTVAYRFDPRKRVDRLRNNGDIRRWATAAQLRDSQSRRVASMSKRDFLRVRETRQELFRIFYAVTRGKRVPAAAVRQIDDELRKSHSRRRLEVHDGGFEWRWSLAATGSDLVLYPVLSGAVELLASPWRRLIRQCADAHCGWLFLDRSHAGSRRWCRMEDCGNRNKVREHYQRLREGRRTNE